MSRENFKINVNGTIHSVSATSYNQALIAANAQHKYTVRQIRRQRKLLQQTQGPAFRYTELYSLRDNEASPLYSSKMINDHLAACIQFLEACYPGKTFTSRWTRLPEFIIMSLYEV